MLIASDTTVRPRFKGHIKIITVGSTMYEKHVEFILCLWKMLHVWRVALNRGLTVLISIGPII